MPKLPVSRVTSIGGEAVMSESEEKVWESARGDQEGGHRCDISDQRKMKAHPPVWGLTPTLEATRQEMTQAWSDRTRT